MSTTRRSTVNSARSRQSPASPRRASIASSLNNSFARLATGTDVSTSAMYSSARNTIDAATPTRTRADAATPRRMSASEVLLPNWQTQGNAMKVYVRVRPFSEREIATRAPPHSTVRIDSDNPSLITILEPSRDFRPMATYSFTRCFWSVFDKNASDTQHARTMSELRDTVDTYLHGGMNSEIRAHARPLSPTPGAGGDSARGGRLTREQSRSDVSAAAYAGAGSSAAMAEVNVSHPPYAGQAEVYEHVGKPVLENTLDGYNGCVFAYGQTGSGKTFTMLGYAPRASDVRPQRSRRESLVASNASFTPTSDDGGGNTATAALTCAHESSTSYERQISPQVIPLETDDGDDVVDKAGMDPRDLQGIIPRISADLFAGLNAKHEKDPTCSARVEVMYYEVYNEKVFDLIRPQRNAELKIRHNPTSGPYVDGLSNTVLLRHDDVLRVLRKGMQERHTAATKFNDRSSRSHAILTFNIVQISLDGGDNPCKMQSKLNLVDLAGSERTGAAGAEGHEFTDGIKINLSLTVLGRVIDCLADLSQNKSLSVPVPYRDSNLTWLLSDSLGGNSQTSMIATVSPHMINFDEMRQTLRYASRAKQIVNRAVRNEDPHMQQINLLVSEIERLQKLLDESGGSGYTREYVLDLERRCRELQRKCDEQEKIIAGLRAELERAHLRDPTAEAGYLERTSTTKSTTPSSRDDAEDVKREAEVATLQITSLRAMVQKKTNDEAVRAKEVKVLKRQVTALTAEKEDVKALVAMLRSWFYHVGGAMLERMLQLAKEKQRLLLRQVAAVLSSRSAAARAHLEQLRSAHEEELSTLRQKWLSDADAERRVLQTRLDGARDEHARVQEQLREQHRREVAQTTAAHEEALRECTAAAQRASDARLEALTRQHTEDVAALRELLRGNEAELLGTVSRLRSELDARERELRLIVDEHDRVQRSKEAEVARLRAEVQAEVAQRAVAVAEQERRRRRVEDELDDAQHALTQAQAEASRRAGEYEGHIRMLLRQQDELARLAAAVVAEYDGKATDMDARVHELRALLYDADYLHFRQRMRDMAFHSLTDYTSQLRRVDEVEQLQRASLLDIASRTRQLQGAQRSHLDRLAQELNDRMSKARSRLQALHDRGSDNNAASSNSSVNSMNADADLVSHHGDNSDGKAVDTLRSRNGHCDYAVDDHSDNMDAMTLA